MSEEANHSDLRFSRPRAEVLARLSGQIEQIWAQFDSARDTEPEFTPDLAKLLAADLPEHGFGEESAIDKSLGVLDQSLAQSRPRFFAYIGSSGLEVGAIADFLTSSFDINMAVDSRAASNLEEQTARWLGDFIGFKDAKGLFTSGGTISNVTALAAARTKALPDSRQNGVHVPVSVYCSAEAHYSNVRAIELLGLGSRSLRKIEIDEQRRMKPEALEAAIQADLAAGVVPIAVIASSGTTLTGAVDPLRAISEICKRYDIWMHIDGAYGAPAAGTELCASIFDGIDLADSVTVDAHKWLFVPKACSILLVKDIRSLYKTFAHDEAYMPHNASVNPVDITLEYSRPLRALKLWMGFMAHGASEFRKAITENVELAYYTYERASADENFRVLPNSPQLSIVPIQYRPAGVSDYSAHNSSLCKALVADGRIYISPAQIDGETWLRPCYTNFRTTRHDVDVMFEVIAEVSTDLLK